MMNRLLKRQIRKYLPEHLASNEDLKAFLDAVNRSYNTSDDQFAMLQKATELSSEELFEANEKLRRESEAQRDVIYKLNSVIKSLEDYDVNDGSTLETRGIDPTKLVDFIEGQTREIIKVNKQKDRLLKSLEHQNRELNDYTHMVSHDLKSPLRSIDSLTAWLDEDYSDKFDQNGKEHLKLIRDSVEKMDTLISGILEYSTIGKSSKKQHPVDLNIIVKNASKRVNIPEHIKLEVLKKLPTIKGKTYRLEQLFYHLISNAVKFNDKEKGLVQIDFNDNNDGYWRFTVSDNGKGIDNVYFDKVFVAFKKLENDHKSTGIGLSIAKRIIDIYHGDIWIESELGKGTTFHFTIEK